jgi:sulfotransferase
MNIIMLSGLPRSGSTVLASMLNQSPEIEVTKTSPLLDVMCLVEEQWGNLTASDTDYKQPTIRNEVLKGILQSGHAHRSKPVIVDKHRLWPRKYELMNSIGCRKIICTVRDITEIVASFLILIEKNSHKVTYIDEDLISNNLPINTKNRANLLLNKYINHPYTSFRVGYQSKKLDMLILSYNDIVDFPQETVNKVCEFVGTESYQVNTQDLQPMNENDAAHGGLEGLHHIRPQLKRVSKSAIEILGHDLHKQITDMKLEFWKS